MNMCFVFYQKKKKEREMILSDASVWHRIISGLKIAFVCPSQPDKAFFFNTLHFFSSVLLTVCLLTPHSEF